MYLIDTLLADAASGIAHVIIDRGVGPKWLVKTFRWHPESLLIDFNPAIVGVPIAFLNWHPVFWVSLSIFTSFAQIFHWCAHKTPVAVRPLQKIRLMLTHEHHKNFCIINGWWLNYVLRALRA